MKEQFLNLSGLIDLVTYMKLCIAQHKVIIPRASFSLFPETGDENNIYIDTSTNAIYRWNDTDKKFVLLAKPPRTIAISEGTNNGEITLKVDNIASNAKVHGLTSTAFTESNKFATAAQGAKADSAVQTITLSSGTKNGTIKIKVNNITTDNIEVAGLGSAAFSDIGIFAAKSHTHTKDEVGLGNVDNTADYQKHVNHSIYAELLNPVYDGLQTFASTWRNNVTDGNVVWGQAWKDPNLSNDTGDLSIWIKQVGEILTANMTIDGTITACMGFIGNLAGNADSASSVPWSGVQDKPSTFPPNSHSHAISDITALQTTLDSKLSRNGGYMAGTANIVWEDSGYWNISNEGVTFPVKRGGLEWYGQSDAVKLYAVETGSDNLELILEFQDDNSNGLSIKNATGTTTARIAADGTITGYLNGTAANANTLGGHGGSVDSIANSYVLRDGNNYAYFNYIHSNTGNNENPAISQIITTNGTDGFYRKSSIDHLKNSLGYMPPSSGSQYYVRVFNSANINSSSELTFNDFAKQHYAMGMIYAAEDNPYGTASWLQAINLGWRDGDNSEWISQIAIGVQNGTGLYYRTTAGGAPISGRPWNTVLDSANFMNYALPWSGGTMRGPLNLANSTWNVAGDDSAFGDHDFAGTFCIKGMNGTPGIKLFNSDDSYYADVLNSANYKSYALPLSGGIMNGSILMGSGNINIQRGQVTRQSPEQQDIFINGTPSSTDIEQAPGIGFHIQNVNYASLKFVADGSFRFYDPNLSGYRPVYASTFYGDLVGTANSATVASYLYSTSIDGTDDVDCLKKSFSSLSKSVGTAVRLQHGSHSMAFGWFLDGYDYDHAYGGWFVSDYGSPIWVGVDNGNWNTCSFITSTNIGSQSVNYANSSGSSNYIEWANIGNKPSEYNPSAHSHPYLPLSGGTLSSGLYFSGQGGIYAGPNDDASGPGGNLNNLVLSSWWGISFTTSCQDQLYSNKTAVGIDCRNGIVKAASFEGNLSGTATNSEYIGNDNQYMRFHWSGKDGQPTWLWGGNEAGNMYVYNPSNFSVNYANISDRSNYLSGHGCKPSDSHPGHGARIFYSWNLGQAGNESEGYSNGITIGSNPGDMAYGFQIVQNMWDDRTYTRRYNAGWQEWKTLAWLSDIPTSLPASDVYAWAKASSKPSYAWSEITGKPSTFTPASHTHNYAGSSSAGGSANWANGATYSNYAIKLQRNPTENKSDDGVYFFQASNDTTKMPNGNWWSLIRTQHPGYANGYWQEIALSFDSDNLAFRRNVNGTKTAWKYVSWSDHTHSDKLGAVSANGFYGMARPDGNTSDWIRTTLSGIIPYQSGGAGSGHCGIGTSSWYFSSIYVDQVRCSNIISEGYITSKATLNVEKSDASEAQVNTSNSVGGGRFVTSGAGRTGIYSTKQTSWLIYMENYNTLARIPNLIQSPGVYKATGSQAANLYITSDGNIRRSTSASKYKLDIQNIQKDDTYAYNLLKLNPRQWFDKYAVENYAEYLTDLANNTVDKTKDYNLISDAATNPYYGLVAEDLEEAGLSEFCDYVTKDGKKELEGIEYDRIPILMIPILRDLVTCMQKILPSVKENIADKSLLSEVKEIQSRFNSFNPQDIVNKTYSN